jgi:hypothetical protein
VCSAENVPDIGNKKKTSWDQFQDCYVLVNIIVIKIAEFVKTVKTVSYTKQS